MTRPVLHAAALALALCALAPPLAAQEPADTLAAPTDTVPAPADTIDTVVLPAPPAPIEERTDHPSPMGAFVRSLIVPGWGQAAVGAYTRGAFYFAVQTGSWYMLLKTIAKLNQARTIEVRRVDAARRGILTEASDSLLVEIAKDPSLLRARIEQDSLVAAIRDLEAAREQQREDWIALTVFWTLLSAADAFVITHLAEFPTWLGAEARRGGGVELMVSIPVGGGP